MIIDDLDVFGVAVPEAEDEPPRAVDRYSPLIFSMPSKSVFATSYSLRSA
jgi:hypothetical protein